MSEGYLQIQRDYLQKAWQRPSDELEACLAGEYWEDGCWHFRAFGEPCALCRERITLGGETLSDQKGILVALYASYAAQGPPTLKPLRSFKELPDSMPYQGAFVANAEQPLVPHVEAIQQHRNQILDAFSGHDNPDAPTGDFSFTLYPLPLVPLYYIFHLPDEDFPASVTCLFAANAPDFMPPDGLADVAEYTAKKIIAMLGKGVAI